MRAMAPRTASKREVGPSVISNQKHWMATPSRVSSAGVKWRLGSSA